MRSEYSANRYMQTPARRVNVNQAQRDGGVTVFALLAAFACVPALAGLLHYVGGMWSCAVLAVVGLVLLAVKNK